MYIGGVLNGEDHGKEGPMAQYGMWETAAHATSDIRTYDAVVIEVGDNAYTVIVRGCVEKLSREPVPDQEIEVGSRIRVNATLQAGVITGVTYAP